MLNLAEYRRRPALLADHLPWVALVAPGVVLNKDGSFQRSFRFRGPDLESATEAELVATCARLNNVLRRFGSGWALFFEAERHEAPGYPSSSFPDAASWLVDRERRAVFEQELGAFDMAPGALHREHFESTYHLTLLHLPPPDQVNRAERVLLELPPGERALDYRDHLKAFVAETDRAFDLLSGIMPECRALDDAETLTFFHGAISTRRQWLPYPRRPCISTRFWPTRHSRAVSSRCSAKSTSAPSRCSASRTPPGPGFSTISTIWASPIAG